MAELTLTSEELEYVYLAVEYFCDKSRMTRDKARLYGRCITKIEAAQEPESWPPNVFGKSEPPQETTITVTNGIAPAYEDPEEAHRVGMERAREALGIAQAIQADVDAIAEAPETAVEPPPTPEPSQGWPQPRDKAVVIAPGEYHGMEVEVVKVYDADTIQVKDPRDGVLLGQCFPVEALQTPSSAGA